LLFFGADVPQPVSDKGAALLGRRPSDVVMGAEPSSTRAVEGALW
jgi:hypothetical protein